MKTNQNNFFKIAYSLAKINLGKTNLNPSVGCVVVKENSVISSGYTSVNGRPHAEYNALTQKKKFTNTDLYVTMEPCTHYGLTPPCTSIIKKRKIKKVYFSNYDLDKRTMKKAKTELSKNKIVTNKFNHKNFKDFYQSYFISKQSLFPLVDAKLAISKDYFTIKKKKWITNISSRKRAHLIRSEYNAIISTSKSINADNSKLNCRLNGFNHSKPDLIIIDIKMKLKKNLSLFKIKKRKIIIITSNIKYKELSFFKKKNIKIVYIRSLKTKKDFSNLLFLLNKHQYQRILVESGLTFLNTLLRNKLISNLYLFKSTDILGKKGKNNASINTLKKIKLKNKIKVNLYGENLYKIKIK